MEILGPQNSPSESFQVRTADSPVRVSVFKWGSCGNLQVSVKSRTYAGNSSASIVGSGRSPHNILGVQIAQKNGMGNSGIRFPTSAANTETSGERYMLQIVYERVGR
jgi:hypothetical protein